MPSGRTHDRITFWSLPWVVGFSYLLTRQGEWTLIVGGSFLFSGLMFGPDLDIYSVQYKRWGLLRWMWLPYQSLLRHRSQLSHGFIMGTAFRLLYLTSIIAVIAIPGVAISQLIWGFDWNWQKVVNRLLQLMFQDYFPEAIALVIGLELGAMSHYLSDWIGSRYQRYRRQKVKAVRKKQPTRFKTSSRRKS
jgi:uncharacterized metal-binding protein